MSTPEPQVRRPPPFANTAECVAAPSCARDRIFQTARNLFYRYGIRGVSVDAIAAEAGTTKVTLYRVFASKDDLIVQCLEDHVRRYWQWWDSVIAPFEGQPRKQIEALFEALVARVDAHDVERGCPVANAAVEIVDENHPARRVVKEHCAQFSQRLRELCRQMKAKRPDELGDALTLLIDGIFTACVLNPKSIDAAVEAARALLDSPTLGVQQE